MIWEAGSSVSSFPSTDRTIQEGFLEGRSKVTENRESSSRDLFFQPAGREPQKYAVMFKGNEVGIGSGQDFQPGCGEDSGIPW